MILGFQTKLKKVVTFFGGAMTSVWTNHARHLAELVNGNKDTQAHLYLEQMMLFPVDIQDRIIEDISRLEHCTNEAVAEIIQQHSYLPLR